MKSCSIAVLRPPAPHTVNNATPSVKSAIGILLNGLPVAVGSRSILSITSQHGSKTSKKIAPMVEWYQHLLWAVFQTPCRPFLWMVIFPNILDSLVQSPMIIDQLIQLGVLNTSDLLNNYSISHTKQHEVRHTVETSAVGRKASHHIS